MSAQQTAWWRRQHRTFVTTVPRAQLPARSRRWFMHPFVAIVARALGTGMVATGRVTEGDFRISLSPPGLPLSALAVRLRVAGRFRDVDEGTAIDATVSPEALPLLACGVLGIIAGFFGVLGLALVLMVIGVTDTADPSGPVRPVAWALAIGLGVPAMLWLYLRRLTAALARDDPGRFIADAFAAREVTDPAP
jgi:hypothetical protein